MTSPGLSALEPGVSDTVALNTPTAGLAAVPDSLATCVSCGRPAATPFCPHCGERRAADRRYSVVHFLTEAIEAVFNTDGTVLRTLRALLLRPGELTAAYMRGILAPFMKPLQLFVVINVVYFIFSAWAGERVFDTRLANHMRGKDYSATASRMVEERLASRALRFESYRQSFDAAATIQAKSLVITMVPLFALVVALVQVRKRRPLLQHLVFSVHAYCVLFIFGIVQRYVVGYPLKAGFQVAGVSPEEATIDLVITLAMALGMSAYFALALRRAYGDRLWMAVPKGVLLLFVGMGLVLTVYRGLLFFTTFSTT